jgi:hypothetical protein
MPQANVKDIRTVKAQFQLRVLDDAYPKEAVNCSIKAQNTLMYLGSKCEKEREAGEDRFACELLRSDNAG